MYKALKKEEAYDLVKSLVEHDSNRGAIKRDLKKLILSCGFSEPVEELFHKCWGEWDTMTSNYFSGQDTGSDAIKTFNSLMSAVSFIDLSELE